MYEYKVVIPLKNKEYQVPIRWLSYYVRDNTNYESLNVFIKKSTEEEKLQAIKKAKKDKVCEVKT